MSESSGLPRGEAGLGSGPCRVSGQGWTGSASSSPDLRNRNSLPPTGLGVPTGGKQGRDVLSYMTLVPVVPVSCVCSPVPGPGGFPAESEP